ncbi:MAG TPA: hypothetical protein VK003_05795, partial [Oceanobacillus sp.]|nr:hypothetical protein [Oceanobacillus sp.]
TFARIQRYATERHELYRLAAKRHLTPDEMSRLHELNGQLPVLWDQHRRELASRNYTPYAFTGKPQAA